MGNSNPYGFGGKSTAEEVSQGIDLSGKVAIVTGSNTGIGLETARALALRGARVILACRDETRGNAAADSINDSVRNALPAQAEAADEVDENTRRNATAVGRAEYLKLDLASFASIRAFCASFQALPGSPALNILINNACTISDNFQTTEDGYEVMYGVGQIGHFLLTSLLMPFLERSAIALESSGNPWPSRVVVLTSTVTVISSKDGVLSMPFKSASKYSMMTAYAQTKLANALFCMELARRSEARGGKVRIFAVHPGVIETNLSHEMMPSFFFKLVALTKKNWKQGAATTVFAATHPWIDTLPNGQYFEDCAPTKSSGIVYSKKLAKKVWDKCKAECGTEPFPETAEDGDPTTNDAQQASSSSKVEVPVGEYVERD